MPEELMPPLVRVTLQTAAALAAPLEICGLIMTNWEIAPIQNVSRRHGNFKMDQDQLVRILSARLQEVIGVYHSHPNSNGPWEPSAIDRDMWMPAQPGWRYWLISRRGVAEWDPEKWKCLE